MNQTTIFENSASFAKQLDEQDPLKGYRDNFFIPKVNGKDSIYLCGNSLGLQPKTAMDHIDVELNDWAKLGVEGHVHGTNPWLYYHHFTQNTLALLTGAQPKEVVAMGSLTNNLHLLMISFYKPTAKRYKILIENRPFPSDQYAVVSQIEMHGFNAADALIEMQPLNGEYNCSTEEILATIEQHKDELALVIMGGVHFYTGQLFDMKSITAAAHEAGAYCGFDLAHAIGNVPLELHQWQVDFACWCSYKYLNSGPGAVAGIFVHQKHHTNNELKRLTGWWGHNEQRRFLMEPNYESMNTAESWQLSNAPVFPMAIHKAALEIFEQVGTEKLRTKSLLLTGYLVYLLNILKKEHQLDFEIITPSQAAQRGCQISLLFGPQGKQKFDKLTAAGVIADWREPGVIRVAPVPLYNTFMDVYLFANLLIS
jgi:kynureninase